MVPKRKKIAMYAAMIIITAIVMDGIAFVQIKFRDHV